MKRRFIFSQGVKSNKIYNNDRIFFALLDILNVCPFRCFSFDMNLRVRNHVVAFDESRHPAVWTKGQMLADATMLRREWGRETRKPTVAKVMRVTPCMP